MPDLLPTPALPDAALTRGGTTVALADPGPIASVAPFPGQGAAVDVALGALGLTFPAPNRVAASGEARLVWTGRAQAFLIGVPAPEGLAGIAALTDQTDGWAALSLTGPLAAEALMRLVPLDLRAAAFAPGHCARAPLGHMNMVLVREDAGFTLLVFRSMARTAWHEIGEALTHLAARAALPV